MEPEFMMRVREDERMEAEGGVMEMQVEQASHLVPKCRVCGDSLSDWPTELHSCLHQSLGWYLSILVNNYSRGTVLI